MDRQALLCSRYWRIWGNADLRSRGQPLCWDQACLTSGLKCSLAQADQPSRPPPLRGAPHWRGLGMEDGVEGRLTQEKSQREKAPHPALLHPRPLQAEQPIRLGARADSAEVKQGRLSKAMAPQKLEMISEGGEAGAPCLGHQVRSRRKSGEAMAGLAMNWGLSKQALSPLSTKVSRLVLPAWMGFEARGWFSKRSGLVSGHGESTWGGWPRACKSVSFPSEVPLHRPAHSLAQGRCSKNEQELIRRLPQRHGSLHSAFSMRPWGVPRSSRPWLPSCQVLFSDFPGCDPLSHLLPRALTPGPGRGRTDRLVPQHELPWAMPAIAQGLAAPCWKEGRDGLPVHPELVTTEIPATGNREEAGGGKCGFHHPGTTPLWAPLQQKGKCPDPGLPSRAGELPGLSQSTPGLALTLPVLTVTQTGVSPRDGGEAVPSFRGKRVTPSLVLRQELPWAEAGFVTSHRHHGLECPAPAPVVLICSVHIKYSTIVAKPRPAGNVPSLCSSGAGYGQTGKVAPNMPRLLGPGTWMTRDEADGRRRNGLHEGQMRHWASKGRVWWRVLNCDCDRVQSKDLGQGSQDHGAGGADLAWRIKGGFPEGQKNSPAEGTVCKDPEVCGRGYGCSELKHTPLLRDPETCSGVLTLPLRKTLMSGASLSGAAGEGSEL
ncbi:hypothetical protein Cadr_000020412 [Camelus dromedarius]|uniref:Uncharacterized protein n=1 Tax=Camelus dromedarius TaxID=9838 RepID=A0A5N4CZX8_CAMDR|nr:hypothetical protein Cadr_000020412 [Camelus dromedarius]